MHPVILGTPAAPDAALEPAQCATTPSRLQVGDAIILRIRLKLLESVAAALDSRATRSPPNS